MVSETAECRYSKNKQKDKLLKFHSDNDDTATTKKNDETLQEFCCRKLETSTLFLLTGWAKRKNICRGMYFMSYLIWKIKEVTQAETLSVKQIYQYVIKPLKIKINFRRAFFMESIAFQDVDILKGWYTGGILIINRNSFIYETLIKTVIIPASMI